MKKDVIRNFTKINRKTPVPQSTLLKKEALAQVFPEFSKNNFLQNTSGRLLNIDCLDWIQLNINTKL